tara:strand:+ start:2298 stop:2519 length:222 start_codon:yes stop_codon:yes gene_type:complete
MEIVTIALNSLWRNIALPSPLPEHPSLDSTSADYLPVSAIQQRMLNLAHLETTTVASKVSSVRDISLYLLTPN